MALKKGEALGIGVDDVLWILRAAGGYDIMCGNNVIHHCENKYQLDRYTDDKLQMYRDAMEACPGTYRQIRDHLLDEITKAGTMIRCMETGQLFRTPEMASLATNTAVSTVRRDIKKSLHGEPLQASYRVSSRKYHFEIVEADEYRPGTVEAEERP